VIETANGLIQDRSRLTSCDFLIANEKDPSRPRISAAACLDSNIASEPA